MTLTSYERATKYMNEALIAPLRQRAKGRLLFAHTTNVSVGKTNMDYDKMTEMGTATTSRVGIPANLHRDDIRLSNSTINLVQHIRAFQVDKARVMAYETEGKDLPTAAAVSAMQRVMEAEDDVLIQGWEPDGSTDVTSGLYWSAGNDFSTSSVFSTAGNAIIAVAGAFALIDADSAGEGVNYNLILNPVEFNELQKAIIADVGPEWPIVMRMLNRVEGAPAGTIMWSNDITTTTGLMSPVDTTGNLITRVVASDVHTVFGTDSKLGADSPLYGHVVEVHAPLIYQANSLCKLSAI